MEFAGRDKTQADIQQTVAEITAIGSENDRLVANIEVIAPALPYQCVEDGSQECSCS